MNKIHITVEDGIEPSVAVEHVAAVMRGGRISDNGRMYCYLTLFPDGTMVRVNEYRKSDCFVVRKDWHREVDWDELRGDTDNVHR